MERGMKFPPRIDPATGRFMESEGAESIKEAVHLILMTQKTERFTRPDYGSRTMSYPFMNLSTTQRHMMERELEKTILSQEPRISEVQVTVKNQFEQDALVVNVEYRIEDTGQVDSMELELRL